MNIIKCSNPKCRHTFRVGDNREKGGLNDPCILEVECPECKSLTQIPSHNHSRYALVEGGNVKRIIQGNLYSHPEFQQPAILTATNGINLKENEVKWSFKDYSLWQTPSHDFELQSSYLLCCNQRVIEGYLQPYIHFYLKGCCPDTAFYIQDYKIGKLKAQAVWAKDIKNEGDLNTSNFYLVHHSRVSIEKNIDGLYTRNEAKVILERLLMRWKYLSNQVVIATPFIGFDNFNSRKEVRQLWDWLDSLVDMDKTKFLTRKDSYNLLKKSYDISLVDSATRSEWQLFDRLTSEADKVADVRRIKKNLDMLDNSPVSFFRQFHAKFYAGIFDNHVEVLVGSYNIHTGKFYDNLIFKRYTKDQFLELYMHKLCPYFRYKETSHPAVLVTHLQSEDQTTTSVMSFQKLQERIKV